MTMYHPFIRFLRGLLALLLPSIPVLAEGRPAEPLSWFKGNTHCHSWWSDADVPPEIVVKQYKERGYNFLVLSDHNVVSIGYRWLPVTPNREAGAELYEQELGPDWVEKRSGLDGLMEYRLKPLSEIRPLFEEMGKFLLIQGVEITDQYERLPVHLNAANIVENIPPQHGYGVLDTIQRNIDAVNAQARAFDQPMLVQINHPNFHYALTAEDLMQVRDCRFIELGNELPGLRDHGDAIHPSVERMWDIVLARRLSDLQLPIMYAVATDDAHKYTKIAKNLANPGLAWIMVRARYLTPSHIVEAMHRGDFYCSTGVLLERVEFADNTLEISIQAEPGVTYTTEFIGTLRDYDRSARIHEEAPPNERVSLVYSEDIGRVLDTQEGTQARYTLTGKELYVRARVKSSKIHTHWPDENAVEIALIQPVQPEPRR